MVRVVAAPAVIFAMLPRVGTVLPRRRWRGPAGLRAIAVASSTVLAPAGTTAAGHDGVEPVE